MSSQGRGDAAQVEQALAFARERIGPASERYLARPSVQTLVLARLGSGAEIEDAVLAELHRAAADDRAVADEFIAHFLSDLMHVARPLVSAGLHRFLDTGDLVQSVVGNVWSELLSVRFESRASFVSYLAQRLRWKASDRRRGLHRQRRGEDLRDPRGATDVPADAAGPSTRAARSEERERLALLVLRLPERDRMILALYLRGASLDAIMESSGLRRDAARKALERAKRRARDLAAADRIARAARRERDS